ncbi:MAG: hypothetical protein NZ960_06555 [Candidatus Kapabacteria bacterium]|nr:hypothetical protein [Candidatus Kapabacteria bacterium]MDW8012764.1 hypothetical protein [Bacteroidota bacterium]
MKQYPPEIIATVGFGWSFQQGTFRSRCSRDFSNGIGSGWLFGLAYSAPLLLEWLWGASVLINSCNLRASYREREPIPFVHPTDTLLLPVEMRNQTILQFVTLTLWGYLRWRPTQWLVASAGPAFFLPLSVHLRHDKELLQWAVRLPSGETLLLQPVTNTTVDSGRPTSRPAIGGLLHCGADFLLGREWWLSFGVYALLYGSSVLGPPATLRFSQWCPTVSLGKTW